MSSSSYASTTGEVLVMWWLVCSSFVVICVDIQFRGAHEELVAFGGVAGKGEEARVGIVGFTCVVYIDLVEVGSCACGGVGGIEEVGNVGGFRGMLVNVGGLVAVEVGYQSEARG